MKNRQETSHSSGSILDAIGKRRLCAIIWRATPFPLRLVAFPYGFYVYRRLLAASDTLPYLREMHRKEFDTSLWFRLLRPRYHRVARLLRDYGYGQAGPASPAAPSDRATIDGPENREVRRSGP